VIWRKKGRIYVPSGEVSWAQHYAFPPTPHHLSDDVLRLYVAFCDARTVGRVGYVDVRPDNPAEILAVSREPVLDIGLPGMFDENGVLPTRVLAVEDQLLMYYVGYQLGAKIPYFQFLGLAVSNDGGETFVRKSHVPVLDRSDAEPLNRTSAFVDRTGGTFRMWYVGGGEWTKVGEKPLPIYNLRYLESSDGVSWGPEGVVCLDFENDDEHAFGRPWVWSHQGRNLMLYSIRTRSRDYRLGLAVSDDGRNWTRRDDEVGIDVSSTGWDSEMIAYASVATNKDRVFMFYNGNARGKTGFGYAELVADEDVGTA
jgi:predicted GH43/DUF377 family glycosyl hydrolase